MKDSDLPPQPEHRERLLNLSTGETVKTGDAIANALFESPSPEGIPHATVHVSPIGENWEVESQSGTLGQTESKVEAEDLALRLAREAGISKVAIHNSDGSVEKEIQVEPQLRKTEAAEP